MKLHKLNARGIAHHFVLALIVVLVAIGGTYYLIMSHADSLTAPVVYLSPGLTDSSGQAYNGISKYNIDTKTTSVLETPTPKTYYSDLAYSHNSRYIAWDKESWTSAQFVDQIQIYDNQTSVLSSYNLPTGDSIGNVGSSLAWSGDDSKLAFAFQNTNISTSMDSLMTMNLDGSGMTVVPNVSYNSIDSLAYTASGQYLVFAGTLKDQSGVYSVAPGQTVATMFTATNGSCGAVRSQTGTSGNTVAYWCGYVNGSGANVGSLLEQTVGSTTQTPLYSGAISSDAGASNTFFEDFAWSPDNSKIAVDQITDTNTGSACSISRVGSLGLITVSDPTLDATITNTSQPASISGCKGGGGGDSTHLAWNAAGTNLIYEGYNAANFGEDGSLHEVAATPGSTPTSLMAAGSLTAFSWGGGSYTATSAPTTSPTTSPTVLAATCSIGSVPTTLASGKSFSPTVTVTNTGNASIAPKMITPISIPRAATVYLKEIQLPTIAPGSHVTQSLGTYTATNKFSTTAGILTHSDLNATAATPDFQCTKSFNITVPTISSVTIQPANWQVLHKASIVTDSPKGNVVKILTNQPSFSLDTNSAPQNGIITPLGKLLNFVDADLGKSAQLCLTARHSVSGESLPLLVIANNVLAGYNTSTKGGWSKMVYFTHTYTTKCTSITLTKTPARYNTYDAPEIVVNNQVSNATFFLDTVTLSL